MNEKQQKNLQINKEIKEWIPTWNYHEIEIKQKTSFFKDTRCKK